MGAPALSHEAQVEKALLDLAGTVLELSTALGSAVDAIASHTVAIRQLHERISMLEMADVEPAHC